jgi:hypothetical protein
MTRKELEEIAELTNAVRLVADFSEFGNTARLYFEKEQDREFAIAWLPKNVDVTKVNGKYFTLSLSF